MPNLVYAASVHEVKIVAGQVLMRKGVVLTADEEVFHVEVQLEAERLVRRVAGDLVHEGVTLLEAMEAGWL